MNEIVCPNCKKTFKLDGSDFTNILKQVRDHEFSEELQSRESQLKQTNLNEIKLAQERAKNELQAELTKKDILLAELNARIKSAETEKTLAIAETINRSEKDRNELLVELATKENEKKLAETSLKDKYEGELKLKDELIAQHKDFKARLSTKMVGETLEQHCETEFNKLRATAFENAYFEKDNDAKTGSKGDYIYRENDESGNEIISIMFEMKNETDTTATKKKNEDFLRELDKDRIEKKCEYAVLVSLLEADSELYNTGIVDVSYRQAKMYVIRPQFFIPIITQLISDGIGYVSDGSVYFSIKNYIASGKTYGRLVSLDFSARARVTNDQDQKEGVADFALWKAYKPGEPFWDFNISGKNYPGRPGWHIECSAMSTEFLGQPFDIHTGGVDLKFPHHENELAQCGGTQANYYIHNEHLSIQSQKMSKSLGNIMTLQDINDPMALRYLILAAHYRSQMDFCLDDIISAEERIKNIRAYTDQLMLARVGQLPEVDDTGQTKKFISEFKQALSDDLNTPKALSALHLLEGKIFSADAREAMRLVDDIMGFGIIADNPLSAEVLDVIDSYELARKDKNFSLSDTLRAKLLSEHGLVASDTQVGTLVHRA